MDDNTAIPILLDDAFYQLSVRKDIFWNPQHSPHIIVVGATGSGKTYLCKLILAKLSRYYAQSELIICDMKADKDYAFLADAKNYYRFMDCANGLEKMNSLLVERQKESSDRHLVILYFDEWASFISSLSTDKKASANALQTLSRLLMMGRSFNLQIIISQQRADASTFGTARDNFNLAIGLGNMSKESQQMLFSDFRSEMLPNRMRGTGYLLANGSNFHSVRVPNINRMDLLEADIIAGTTRYETPQMPCKA
ncbi:type IV secretory system conjugative DNA transfer family protein [Lachnoclostridium edouardi]|uniref:type IV secretory system conjugative DNA transfer family protein n=1 Tax=Lachnoclostridium edouardi TaxID=1926283 RepID=UPI000C7B1C93|nr:AAA family ATPase [Lachnoclostridium edouardi]